MSATAAQPVHTCPACRPGASFGTCAITRQRDHDRATERQAARDAQRTPAEQARNAARRERARAVRLTTWVGTLPPDGRARALAWARSDREMLGGA